MDGQGGFLVIFKIDSVIPIGIEGNELWFCIHEVGGGHRFLRDFIYPGQQVLQGGRAVRPGLDLIHAVAVCRLHQEYGVRHGLPGVRVPLHYRQVGALIVFQDDGGGSARKQLHMALHRVDDVV